MHRTYVLINNTSLGGAERRLGRLFARMAKTDAGSCLVVNEMLWRQLLAAGVVTEEETRVWRLAEPCSKLAVGLGLWRGSLSFWIKKLDYLFFACLLLIRYTCARRRLFHLALGGTYVALPLMLVRPGHRFVNSVTNRNLAGLVGVPWALPIYRFALSRCDAIDALSAGIRADLSQRGIAVRKIVTSPGSVVDLDRYYPAAEKEPWVVFAGRFVEEKRPVLFLEAIPAIVQAVPSARFFLLGEGPLRSAIDETLDRLQLRRRVQVGFLPDPVPVLSKACVFVSLQRQDNYPSQSLLEAMACCAVPVATDVGLTWQLVDETTGILVKPDPSEIAQSVITLLKDPPRCDRLGQAGRRRVAEQHSEERYRQHLVALYAGVEPRGECDD